MHETISERLLQVLPHSSRLLLAYLSKSMSRCCSNYSNQRQLCCVQSLCNVLINGATARNAVGRLLYLMQPREKASCWRKRHSGVNCGSQTSPLCSPEGRFQWNAIHVRLWVTYHKNGWISVRCQNRCMIAWIEFLFDWFVLSWWNYSVSQPALFQCEVSETIIRERYCSTSESIYLFGAKNADCSFVFQVFVCSCAKPSIWEQLTG
jgi:hypothetical protein